jgi:Leucine-rich repeat (LRR) protein
MWNIDDFNKWVKEGRPINENIISLNIDKLNNCTFSFNFDYKMFFNFDYDKIGNLENLVNLKKLSCCSNQLKSLKEIKGIEKLVNLKILHCNDNQLSSLEGIENLQLLKKLHCYNNQLTSLEGIEKLVNLNFLWCSGNQLTSLKGIENLQLLKNLHCYNNQLTSLECMDNLINLKTLSCAYNQLSSLKGIENLQLLKTLYCQKNQLTSLEGIEKLVNLEYLHCNGNKLISICDMSEFKKITSIIFDVDCLTISNFVKATDIKNNNFVIKTHKLLSSNIINNLQLKIDKKYKYVKYYVFKIMEEYENGQKLLTSEFVIILIVSDKTLSKEIKKIILINQKFSNIRGLGISFMDFLCYYYNKFYFSNNFDNIKKKYK